MIYLFLIIFIHSCFNSICNGSGSGDCQHGSQSCKITSIEVDHTTVSLTQRSRLRDLDSNTHPQIKCIKSTCHLKEDSLRFFLIGDWGGLPMWPYCTLAQKKAAKAMGKMGTAKNTHFQVSLGDNMYIVGLTSSDHKRFEKTFEDIYDYSDAMYRPWYILAGNHDYYGDIDVQLAYTQKSNRWAFPDYYYTIKYHINNATIDIIMIDTVILCGNTREGKYLNFFEYFLAPSADRKTQGPENNAAAKKHLEWLEDQLSKSKANYLFVAGHYPVYSVAEHGPTECLVEHLRPLLEKYKVNAYFSGHEHSLQHLAEKFNNGWKVHYVLSGAGAFELQSDKNQDNVPAGSSLFVHPNDADWNDLAAKVGLGKGGFVYAEVDQKKASFHYVLGDSSEVYKFTLWPKH